MCELDKFISLLECSVSIEATKCSIERDSFIELLRELKEIKSQNTQLKHGYWFFTEYEFFTCSVCGESYFNHCDCSDEARAALRNGDFHPYCSHCGAKMDGEKVG